MHIGQRTCKQITWNTKHLSDDLLNFSCTQFSLQNWSTFVFVFHRKIKWHESLVNLNKIFTWPEFFFFKHKIKTKKCTSTLIFIPGDKITTQNAFKSPAKTVYWIDTNVYVTIDSFVIAWFSCKEHEASVSKKMKNSYPHWDSNQLPQPSAHQSDVIHCATGFNLMVNTQMYINYLNIYPTMSIMDKVQLGQINYNVFCIVLQDFNDKK